MRLVRLVKTAAEDLKAQFLAELLRKIEAPATIAEQEAEDARFHRNLISADSASSISPESG